MLYSFVLLFSTPVLVSCDDITSKQDREHCSSLSWFNRCSCTSKVIASSAFRDCPCCDINERKMSSRLNKSPKRSKYFANDASSASSSKTDRKSPKKSRTDLYATSQQQDVQSIDKVSQDSNDDTLPYDDDYSRNDFVTSSDSDEDFGSSSIATEVKSNRATIEISDNSSDEDETESKPWRQAPNKGKYTMRQTTLNFAKNSKGSVKPSIAKVPTITRSKFKYSDLDTEEYRKGYPGKKDDLSLRDNLLFYKGSIRSHPDGDFIDNIHQSWFGNYKRLERHHGYIQWLFPIRENGMNWHAQALQLHEAKAIQSDKEMRLRVLHSYRLMLDFYGMKLVDVDSGKIQRSQKWQERFENLKWSSHNYLRITRILKSLGELGYERLKKPFLEFVLHEALEERTLERLLRSCDDYWIGTIKDDKDREKLHKIVHDKKRKV